jgi:PTH1 family peptidyl-tRNA hydrolase
MKIVIGLGNPEEKFAGTRHNIGFHIVNRLAEKLEVTFENKPALFSEVARAGEVILVKPQTYMNDSGRATQAVLSFYKAAPADLIVVHDDLDLELGKWKQQFGTGPKEHNGLLSLYRQLGTEDFTHLRIGVDNRNGDRSIPGKEYVLQRFSAEEVARLGQVTEAVIAGLLT